MKYKYKTIDISTEKGLKEAERLKEQGYNKTENGYKMITLGLTRVQFEIPIKSD